MNPLSITSDDPGISVRAPATRPPVQDSAVAMVSLRIRQRSSSERERARASLPLISSAPGYVVPRQTDGCARERGNAFLSAGESQPFAGGSLHRHPRDRQARDFGNAPAHRFPERTDFRPLANQRHIKMCNPPATRSNPIDRVFQEFIRWCALPLRVARRKMRTDIPVGQGSEYRIDQRVKADIAIGMREKAAAVRNPDAADHQVIAFAKSVNVVAAAGSNVAQHSAETSFFADEIFR